MINFQAYIDPNTATYLVTAIAGVVLAAGVTVGLLRKKLIIALRKSKMERLEKKLSKRSAQTDENN